MGPAKKVEKYDLKGNLGEMVRYCEEFRQKILMEAKHCQDRVQKLIHHCIEMDEFFNEHMLVRANIRKAKVLEARKTLKEYRKAIKAIRKTVKGTKKKSTKLKLKKKMDKFRKKRDKIKMRLSKLKRG